MVAKTGNKNLLPFYEKKVLPEAGPIPTFMADLRLDSSEGCRRSLRKSVP